MELVDGWEPVAPMVWDGHSLASMLLEGWLKVLLCLFQHQQGHPMAEGIMAVDAMGVDATKQESMVSLILSRPTGQDGGWFLIEGATDFVILQESFSPL